jgi:ribonuclease R
MKELYHKLKARRVENGELDFDFPEPELIQDELGRTIDVVKSARDIAHGIIEEFMIEANSAVANYVFNAEVPSIYRVHQPPDIGAIKELAEALKKLGFSLKVGEKVRAQDLQKILNESTGSRHQLAVHTLVLQSLKRAIYSTQPLGHFGLALDHYTHFTSPIRRYPDLVVHRIVDALIKGRSMPYDEETLVWIASNSSARERFAAEVEREAVEIERVYMMKSHIGSEFDGFVTSVMPFGLFVELNQFFVEGLVPRRKIHYPKDKKFDIGESVKVRLIAADLTKRKMTFELVK